MPIRLNFRLARDPLAIEEDFRGRPPDLRFADGLAEPLDSTLRQ